MPTAQLDSVNKLSGGNAFQFKREVLDDQSEHGINLTTNACVWTHDSFGQNKVKPQCACIGHQRKNQST